jgi:hypothetical protein
MTSHEYAFDKLRSLKMEHDIKTHDEKSVSDLRNKENRAFDIKILYDRLDTIFPSYEDIKNAAKNGNSKYIILHIEEQHNGTRNDYDYVEIDPYLCLSHNKERNVSIYPFHWKSTTNNEYKITPKLLYDYLKTKSIPELGYPTCKKTGFWTKYWNIYYEW